MKPRGWPDVADTLREGEAAATQTVVEAMRSEVPLFARPLEGGFGRDLVATARASVLGLADHLAGLPPDRSTLETHRETGRREVRLGRQLGGLLAGYGAAQRTLWRMISTEALNGDADGLDALGESVMAFFDLLTAAAAEGFAEETARHAGEAQRRSDELVTLLIRQPPADAALLQGAVDAHPWRPGDELAVLTLQATDTGDRARLASRLPPDALIGARGDLLCALIPDPGAPGRLDGLLGSALDAPASLGPPVPWTEAGASFAVAVRGLDLAVPGAVYRCDAHLLELWLRADPVLARRMSEQSLAGLEGESPSAREKLEATLAAFFDHHGHQGAMAHALGLHPQTVRYRLARLRDVFGSRLDDPDERLAMALALRLRALERGD